MADLCEMDVWGYLSREEGGYAKRQCLTEWRNGTIDECIQKLMILQRLDYDVTSLLRSSEAVAICQLEGEELKNMILTVRERWGLVVIETPSGEHWLIVAARPVHQGNLVGDIRKWTQQYGYQFYVKRSDEKLSSPRHNSFLLPDGRQIEIRSVLTRASNFTHWGLSKAGTLPAGYVRV